MGATTPRACIRAPEEYMQAIVPGPVARTTDLGVAMVLAVRGLPTTGHELAAAALAVVVHQHEQPSIALKTDLLRHLATMPPSAGAEEYIATFTARAPLWPHVASLVARGPQFTFRQLLKRIGYGPMFLVAATSADRVPVAYLLAGYALDGSYSNVLGVMGFAISDFIAALDKRCDIVGGLSAAARTHPAYDRVMQSLDTGSPSAAISAPADPTQGSEPVAVEAPAPAPKVSGAGPISVADNIKPLVNSVLQSSGIGLSIDDIIAVMNDRDYLRLSRDKLIIDLANAVQKHEAESEELTERLRCASLAQPTAPVVVSADANSRLPSGKADLVPAGSVFPGLVGVKLQVPMWAWDTPHPHVPAKVDGYIFRNGLLLRALRCLANGENVWLQGHTGSGKTTFVEQIAAALNWPMLRVALDSSIDRAELVGRVSIKGDGKGGTDSEWVPGVLERSLPNGYILLLDEITAGRPDALLSVQPVLEGKGLLLLEDGGRIINSHPMTRIVATDNTFGNGDPSGLYSSRRILEASTLDRFSEFIHVPYITQKEEEGLLKQHTGLKAAMLRKIASFATEMRVAFTRGELPVSFSPRRSVAFARAVEDFTAMVPGGTEVQAINMALRGKIFEATPEEFRPKLVELAKVSLGTAVDPGSDL